MVRQINKRSNNYAERSTDTCFARCMYKGGDEGREGKREGRGMGKPKRSESNTGKVRVKA